MRRWHIQGISILLFMSAPVFSQPADTLDLSSGRVTEINGYRYWFGDHPQGASMDLEDSSWQEIGFLQDQPRVSGIHWYRARIHLSGERDLYDILSLRISSLGSAFEVYWDGNRIGTNGRVASVEEEETPGKIVQYCKLHPDWTRPGDHVLALRFSNHRIKSPNFPFPFWVRIGYFSSMQESQFRFLWTQYFLAGFYFLAIIVCVSLAMGGKRHLPYLFFAVYFLASLASNILAILIRQVNPSIVFLVPMNWVIQGTEPLLILMVNVFFIFNTVQRNRLLHLVPNVMLIPLLAFMFRDSFWILQCFRLHAAGLTAYSLYKRRPGSPFAFLAALILVVKPVLQELGNAVSLSLDTSIAVAFALFMLLAMGRQNREEDRKRQESQLHSVRLEAELLKRNIQPHFLMNTLLSIISWIEESPGNAIRMIRSFADEFRIIHRVSSELLIPIGEELRLCRAHLDLMSTRTEAQYRLATENVDEEETIPPLVFHTLIENALTHAYESGEGGTFCLSVHNDSQNIQYCLENDGSRLDRICDFSDVGVEEGMGMKYVKARLEESYPGRWRLMYGMENGKWKVHIILRKAKP